MKIARVNRHLSSPSQWQALRWGEQFQTVISNEIQPWLTKIYGSHFIKIGELSHSIDTSRCAISHQVRVGKNPRHADIVAEKEKLPLISKSVDACLIAHTLAWSQDPHQVLREVDRVLVDDGWVLLSEFNPFSLLGCARGFPGVSKKARFYSRHRLVDWLSLLNYEIVSCRTTQVLPWRTQRGVLTRHFPCLGCITFIVARKRTYPLTLAKKQALNRGRHLRPAVNVSRQICSLGDHQDADK
ncbi:class I SAM-dependent methyltransferase [Rosenbergiella australiborealis]|uniref:Class I SAM-dependent methyltransferase n=1 Tax=Rosenbergiella australiborealis TaxID=1544696 RepID=A0ABS5T9U0_9GAMM|nr:methyltransferase domain-containing protein [Rosenbergiella australiborealis]MBT0728207.1 class I SAM-dependent methyltransferase [Rosenbergiella australiborealis]